MVLSFHGCGYGDAVQRIKHSDRRLDWGGLSYIVRMPVTNSVNFYSHTKAKVVDISLRRKNVDFILQNL